MVGWVRAPAASQGRPGRPAAKLLESPTRSRARICKYRHIYKRKGSPERRTNTVGARTSRVRFLREGSMRRPSDAARRASGGRLARAGGAAACIYHFISGARAQLARLLRGQQARRSLRGGCRYLHWSYLYSSASVIRSWKYLRQHVLAIFR